LKQQGAALFSVVLSLVHSIERRPWFGLLAGVLGICGSAMGYGIPTIAGVYFHRLEGGNACDYPKREREHVYWFGFGG